MKENYVVCHCKKVSYFDIADALYQQEKFDDVLKAFEDVKKVTRCSTGCGGCHDKVLDVISELLMGHEKV
ncbi:MAG: (2Fe-2S)-binding protein [Clostridia bacterium]|nr:(2Fe-2S)-binding protein [Clostridia bacterium]